MDIYERNYAMGKNVISRRRFLGRTSAGIGLVLIGQSASVSALDLKSARDIKKLRREVKIASIDMRHLFPEESLDAGIKKILSRMEKAAAYQPDIICLPESFSALMVSERRPRSEIAEDENTPGPVTSRIGEFAKKHSCYVICPVITKNEGVMYNSAILLDREGKISGVFHKTRPVDTEIKEGKGVIPGPVRPPVFKTDFGKIGMQMCFDANWFDSWGHLKKQGAEIIFFPSQAPFINVLKHHAWINQAYIVSSTGEGARIIDITGDEIAVSGYFERWACAAVNLEKALLHVWPFVRKVDDIRKKYKNKINVKIYHPENWMVLESRDPGIRVKDILREYEIPTYDEHISKNDKVQNKYRH